MRISAFSGSKLSFFHFLIIRSESGVLHIGTKWRCFILWSGSGTMLHLARRFYEARLTAYEAALRAMKRTFGA